jgi:hypothetical protein
MQLVQHLLIELPMEAYVDILFPLARSFAH